MASKVVIADLKSGYAQALLTSICEVRFTIGDLTSELQLHYYSDDNTENREKAKTAIQEGKVSIIGDLSNTGGGDGELITAKILALNKSYWCLITCGNGLHDDFIVHTIWNETDGKMEYQRE